MPEDKFLIEEFNRGNIDALRRIYEKYKDDLLRLAKYLLNDNNAAEDVIHDVFVSFSKTAGKFGLDGKLKGYLATCVVNCVRNKLRSKRHLLGLDEIEPIISNSNEPDQSVIYNEELQQLITSLSQLPYQQREIILSHLVGGLSFRQIATSQNISVNTIKSRYRRALKNLRVLLDCEK